MISLLIPCHILIDAEYRTVLRKLETLRMKQISTVDFAEKVYTKEKSKLSFLILANPLCLGYASTDPRKI
jgi:hypothetical protein